jgi:VanZ family protein
MKNVRRLTLPGWLNWGLAGGYSALIFYLSSRTSVPLPGIPGIDKAAHLTEYAGYSLLAARALFPLLRTRPRGVRWWVAVVWCVAFALSDEVHQAFVPGRSCDTWDAFADAAGAIGAAVACELIRITARFDLTGVR